MQHLRPHTGGSMCQLSCLCFSDLVFLHVMRCSQRDWSSKVLTEVKHSVVRQKCAASVCVQCCFRPTCIKTGSFES